MGIEDRDWYRDEVRNRESNNGGPSPPRTDRPAQGRSSTDRAIGLPLSGVLAMLAFAVLVVMARDMKDRGVPFSWQGVKWWLSLWLGA